jgi:hypothetical protein
MSNKFFKALAVGALGVTGLIVGLACLLRNVLPALLGSGNDLGVWATPFVGIGGIVGLLWLAYLLLKCVVRILNQKEK